MEREREVGKKGCTDVEKERKMKNNTEGDQKKNYEFKRKNEEQAMEEDKE